jgi:Domain of unknown function (DUF4266)
MTRTLAVLCLMGGLGCCGCATVPPYERSSLMRRSMLAKPALDAAFDTHVAELRESAMGATSGENASCGCR